MSICHNKDLYSVYVDGELPSPWKEKLEESIERCPEGKQTIERYRHISAKLAEIQPPELDMEASFIKLCKKRDAVLKDHKLYANDDLFKAEADNWFRKSVNVPLPAVVAAVFILLFTPLLLFNAKKTSVVVKYVEAPVSNFKPIVPVVHVNQSKQKKFTFRDLEAFGIKNDEVVRVSNKRPINLSNFMSLYISPSTNSVDDIIVIPGIDNDFVNLSNEIELAFIENE